MVESAIGAPSPRPGRRRRARPWRRSAPSPCPLGAERAHGLAPPCPLGTEHKHGLAPKAPSSSTTRSSAPTMPALARARAPPLSPASPRTGVGPRTQGGRAQALVRARAQPAGAELAHDRGRVPTSTSATWRRPDRALPRRARAQHRARRWRVVFELKHGQKLGAEPRSRADVGELAPDRSRPEAGERGRRRARARPGPRRRAQARPRTRRRAARPCRRAPRRGMTGSCVRSRSRASCSCWRPSCSR